MTIYVLNNEYQGNVDQLLDAWRTRSGPDFLTLDTSGTTGHPKTVAHSRDVIEQAVESNIKVLNLSRSSRIVSIYSPRGIAFTTLSLYIAERLGCDLFIESFTGLGYVNRLNILQPTHTLILPNVWKALSSHPKWESLDLRNCDTAITGSDFTPTGMLDELHSHGPRKVYNVYGSTEVPPMVLVSEEENTYSLANVPSGCEIKIQDDQLACRWTSQRDWWISGDLVEGTLDRFTLKGRALNMFKQDYVRVYPEQVEKLAVSMGAYLALCQQVNNHCVVHYVGPLDTTRLTQAIGYIPRLRMQSVNEIKLDNNLKKIIRTQTFES
jgi:acyl-coenzyme A synthetase/AMP-(fatty) acid ligase